MERSLRWWAALPGAQRTLAIALIGAALVAATVAIVLRRDTTVALFAVPLHPEQVAEVVDRLAEWNAPFVSGADNVRVSRSLRSSLLLRLALAGVPHAHVATTGEALARVGPLTPQAVLDAQTLDGLAGDLALGLRGINGVEDARVIIAPARPALFASDVSSGATASVRLRLRAGTQLEPDAVSGIRAFVAAGVPSLEPTRVTLIDDRGLALGDPARAWADDAPSLQSSLQSALDQAFGMGTTIVRVRVTHDASRHQLHQTKRAPLAGTQIAATTLAERYTGERKSYTKTHSNLDRGSDVRDERTEVPAGRLERISVAVMVDATRGLDIEKVRDLARATTGLVPQRGDSLHVEALPFVHSAVAAPSRFAMVAGYFAAILPTLAIVAGIVIAVGFGAKPLAAAIEPLFSRIAVRRTSRAVAAFAPSQVRGALRGEPPHTAAAIISALPTATATAVLELYPPEERAAIVRRMARATSAAVPEFETLLRHG